MADDFSYVALAQSDKLEPVSMNDLIASMSNMEDEPVDMFHCSYGDPGSHKTVETMKMVKGILRPDQKVVYVDSGKGWVSLMNHPELMHNVKRIQFTKWEQFDTLRDFLANPEYRKATNIGAVVFDEFNRMQDMDIMRLTKGRAAQNNSDDGKRLAGSKWQYKDPYTPQWPEYNTSKQRMVDLMTSLLTIPDMHVFFVCHTRIDRDTKLVVPDFPKGAGSVFLSLVHSCYYFSKQEVTQNGKTGIAYPIETFGGSMTVSKNRIGTLPQKVYSGQVIAEHYLEWAKSHRKDEVIPGEVVEEAPAPEIEAPVNPEPKVSEPEVAGRVQETPTETDPFDLSSMGL